MTTSKKRKRISPASINYNNEQVIYPEINDKYVVPKDSDPLAFVVPWQISDNRKNR